MKKIFAIFLGLLLLGTVFGIASVGATLNGHCDCEIIGPSTVHVGDTFQVKVIRSGSCTTSASSYTDFVEWVGEGPENIPGGYLITYKAIRPGTPNMLVCCGYMGCNNYYTVTVVPKEYPMDQFMKILEKNKNK